MKKYIALPICTPVARSIQIQRVVRRSPKTSPNCLGVDYKELGKLFLLLPLFLLLFLSCRKDDILQFKERPLVGSHEITVEPIRSTYDINVFNGEITISIDNATKSWCDAKLYTSLFGWAMKITTSGNYTGKKRSGKITVSEGTKSEDIIINQEYLPISELQMRVIPGEKNQVKFYLSTLGAMIDWGDNSEIEECTNDDYIVFAGKWLRTSTISHQYADREPRNIKLICRFPSGQKCTFLTSAEYDKAVYKEILFGKIDVPAYIHHDRGQLEKIDVTNLALLEELICSGGELASIDLSYNRHLKHLSLSGNKLTSLDLSANTELIDVSCSSNQLPELNISDCIKLTDLYCNNNQLKELDISNNTKLKVLECDSNQLMNLNLNECVELKTLKCNNNRLENLDFTNNKKMEYIECKNNLLSASSLNLLFTSLPYNGQRPYIYIENNPGAADCDITIAYNKGSYYVRR